MPRKLCFLKGHMTITHTFVCCKFLLASLVCRRCKHIEKEKQLIAGIISLMISSFRNNNCLSGRDCVSVSTYFYFTFAVNTINNLIARMITESSRILPGCDCHCCNLAVICRLKTEKNSPLWSLIEKLDYII